MSLINKMFRLLEKRRMDESQTPTTMPEFSQTEQRVRYFKRLFIILSVLAILLVALDGWVIYDHYYHPQHAVATDQSNGKPALEAPVPETPQVIEPAVLSGVVLDVLNDRTQIRFLLSRPVLYQLASEPTHQVYTITFDRLRAAAVLPALNNPHSAIQDLQMSEAGEGGLTVRVTLKKGAHLIEAGTLPATSTEFLMTVQAPPAPPLPAAADNGLASVPAPLRMTVQQGNDFASQSLSKAIELTKAGETDKAITLLEGVVNISPGWHEGRETLARLLIQQRRMAEAEALLKAGISQDPKWVPYIELLAHCLQSRGHTQEAINLLAKTSPLLSRHPSYYALMAALYQQNHEPMMAATLYQQLISGFPGYAKWWLGYAVALDAMDRREEAQNAFHQALDASEEPLSPALRAWVETRLHPL